MNRRLLSMEQAAKLLGTTRPALMRMLRDAGHLHGSLAAPELVNAGLFRIEQQMVIRDDGIRKHYQVTRVTIQGLAWLELRLDALRMKEAS